MDGGFMFGIFEHGVLTISNVEQEGYLPMVWTVPPKAEEGYEALFYWAIESDAITQTWEVVEVSEEELSDEEALSVLIGEVET